MQKAWREYTWGHALTERVRTQEGRDKMRHPHHNKGKITWYHYTCEQCGVEFKHQHYERKYCSTECYHIGRSGENSNFYTRGSRTKYKNYKDPITGIQTKYHRIIMSEHMGRALTAEEVVHHIDGNGLNNDINNLHLFHCDGCHNHYHQTGKSLKYKYDEYHVRKENLTL